MAKLCFTRIRGHFASGAAVLAISASQVFAQGLNFALPEQPLSESLKAVARQTGENILFTPDAVSGLRAPSLTGQMSAQDAVKQLLRAPTLSRSPTAATVLLCNMRCKRAARLRLGIKPKKRMEAARSGLWSARRAFSIAGYQQPTPVTVVGAAQLERDANTDIGDCHPAIAGFGRLFRPQQRHHRDQRCRRQ